MWKAILDIKTCRDCRKKYGKIYEIKEKVIPPPPLHWLCRCQIVRLRAILAGNATKLGVMGAERIVYSSDGLIFVTYNHYETFMEIK